MKAVFIAFNQAHEDDVLMALRRMNVRGYTGWTSVIGAGTQKGEPHLGSHAWPTLNAAYLSMVPDTAVVGLLEMLKSIDEESPQLGLRAFVWSIENMI